VVSPSEVLSRLWALARVVLAVVRLCVLRREEDAPGGGEKSEVPVRAVHTASGREGAVGQQPGVCGPARRANEHGAAGSTDMSQQAP
jgi:hypothetical protein